MVGFFLMLSSFVLIIRFLCSDTATLEQLLGVCGAHVRVPWASPRGVPIIWPDAPLSPCVFAAADHSLCTVWLVLNNTHRFFFNAVSEHDILYIGKYLSYLCT